MDPSRVRVLSVLLLLCSTSPVSSQGKRPEDPKRYIEAMISAITQKPTSIPSVLAKYDRFEGAKAFTDEGRYRMHSALVETINSLDGAEVVKQIKKRVKRSARSSLPSIVVMMKAIVYGKHGMKREERIATLVEIAKGKSAQLALWTIRLLGDSGWAKGVDALIGIMRHEESNARTGSVLWHQASDELYRVLGSGVAHGTAASIEKAWKEMGKKLPENPDHDLTKSVGEGRGATVVFFGDKISPRSIFCIDTSTSMRQPARIKFGGRRTVGEGEDDGSKKEPKIDVVKRELVKALGGLLRGFKFNIFSYNASPSPWRKARGGVALVAVSSSSLDSAKEFARELPTEPGTNIHDTLAAALEVADVDTIYLLSDGQPSRGGGPKPINRTVKYKNYLRGIRIVTYGIVPEKGQGSFDEAFMKGLARSNWGWYRKLNG